MAFARNHIEVVTEHLFAWWRRTRRLTIPAALCRAGAALGNWNDRVRGQHQVRNFVGRPRIERTLTWHVVDRIAGWLYVAPERRRP